ncbi:hypothetical protein STRTUCAR8_03907 [Streptomyces turgidiscabies Car8]|uniref:Uncharacterized protein n=1 Tax=Streptomyces turgidiscabies (strain Car8) TaxID=698760 RepID=L7FBN0_STRT8|nr:hypothetical protein STRTUCAR8_03907 [Streptomyces turgidiscabies Car8]
MLGHGRPTSGQQRTLKSSHLPLPQCKVSALRRICARQLSFIRHRWNGCE